MIHLFCCLLILFGRRRLLFRLAKIQAQIGRVHFYCKKVYDQATLFIHICTYPSNPNHIGFYFELDKTLMLELLKVCSKHYSTRHCTIQYLILSWRSNFLSKSIEIALNEPLATSKYLV